MGCFSSKSRTSSQEYRYTNEKIPKGFDRTHRTPLELQLVTYYHESINSSIGGLWPGDSGENRRYSISHTSYPPFRHQVPTPKPPARPRFGEYRCICGRTWSSRLSWQGNYQICKRCKRSVHPHSQRELLPSDITNDKEKCEQHPKELCQKCKQLGSYCGKRQNVKPRYQARLR
ncbi:uncharacterized protein LOC115450425 isoform X1 [Manduca sexta]|nr:uncharacterized protein LOC115450425 isoform X1 [Manduca sexta]KAG6460734.1 hypothetical protein O3G_MSEX012180 [Manduca sexta]